MTNSKTTRKALLSSALALTMCVAMLVATTFAWFTDTASTAVNRIQAGNLDVELVKPTANENGTYSVLDNAPLKWVKATDGSGQDVLWEPGCTYNLESFRIKNNGNLNLKYKVIISGLVGSAKLLNAIDFTVAVDGTALVAKDGTSTVSTVANLNNFEGKLDAGAVTGKITITGTMKTTAGNEYQDETIDGIAITVVATQMTGEYDSTVDDYDALAQYPVYTVANVETKNDNGVTKVETSVTISSKEKTTIDNTEVSIAEATIPAEVVLEPGTTQVKLVVKDSQETPNITIESGQAKKTLEVKLEGVSSSNTVPATVSFYIEKGLANLTLYHTQTSSSGTVTTSQMKAKDNEEAVTDNQDYYYNSVTGKVTIKSATFSPFTYTYDAKIATPQELANATNEDDKTVAIGSAELLRAFARAVNADNKKYAGYTISLTSDINLGGASWTPIKWAKQGDNDLNSLTFDGNGKTISNFKIAVTTEEKHAGFFSCADGATIKNLTISGATVKGYNWVGALVGGGYCTKIEKCHVKKSDVTAETWLASENGYDDGDKAGAIAGCLNEGDVEVKNCTVTDCKIKGYRDIGGLIGYLGIKNNTITGNSVSSTTITCDKTNDYKRYGSDTTKYDVNNIIGEKSAIGSHTMENNTATEVTIN